MRKKRINKTFVQIEGILTYSGLNDREKLRVALMYFVGQALWAGFELDNIIAHSLKEINLIYSQKLYQQT